jgi:hypothetical protein
MESIDSFSGLSDWSLSRGHANRISSTGVKSFRISGSRFRLIKLPLRSSAGGGYFSEMLPFFPAGIFSAAPVAKIYRLTEGPFHPYSAYS